MVIHTFSVAQLEALRANYAPIETVNPDRLSDFHKIFDGCSDAAITQLVDAGIKFVSKLARNEKIRRSAK